MPVVSVNDTALVYDAVGSGEPLVLIHGSWSDRTAWEFLAPPLAASFQVIAFDRRGHGDSDASPVEGTVHDDVADVSALIETLGLAPAHVVGTSYGACVALRFAVRHPSLIRRMAIHEPPLLGLLDASPGGQPVAEEERRKLGEVRRLLERGDHRDAAERFVETVALGPGAWEQLPPPVQERFVRHAPTFLGELRDPDALAGDTASLGEIRTPILLTQGDQSPPMFAMVVDLLAETLPEVTRCVVEGAGHVPHITHPDAYADVLREFLASSQRA
jgi:pimeloyl-ACP methyl ester carboxylesterase